MKWVRNLGLVLAALVVIPLVALYGLVQWVDVSRVTARVEKEVARATGRELMIQGAVEPVLGFQPMVTLYDVALANPKWAKDPHLFSAKKMTVTLQIMPLLQGKVRLKQVQISDAVVALERSKKGTVSWNFTHDDVVPPSKTKNDPAQAPKSPASVVAKAAASSAATAFHIEHLGLENSVVTYFSHASGKKETILLTDLQVNNLDATGIEAFTLAGTFHKQQVDLSGSVANQRLLMLTGAIEGTHNHAALSGSFDMHDSAFDLEAKAQADTRSPILSMAGLKSKEAFPFTFTAKFGGTPDVITLANVQAASSDWEGKGSGTLNLSAAKPFLDAKIALSKLKITSTNGKQSNADQASTPADPAIDLSWMNQMNAHLLLDIAALDYDGIAIQKLGGTFSLKDGQLEMNPLSLGMAGGTISGNVSVKGNTKPAQYKVDLVTDHLMMEQLVPLLTDDHSVRMGPVKAAINLMMTGDTMPALRAGADGHVNLFMDKANYDVSGAAKAAESFIDLLRGRKDEDGWLGIQCAVGQFDVAQGVATSKVLALKTSGAVADGSGSVNIGDSTMNIVMRARSGSIGLADMVPPIRFKGPISNPHIIPDPGGTLLGIGKMVLGATTGIGLVAVLGERATDQLGITSDNNPCLSAIAKQTAQKPEVAPTDAAKEELGNLKNGMKKLLGR